MKIGSFVFMLHSHLPYYRKAGMWPFGEENLYECMAETYIPLLNTIGDLQAQGVQAKLTVGITPILAEQLADEHLKNGFVAYLDARIKAVTDDLRRFTEQGGPARQLQQLAMYYLNWYWKIKSDYLWKYDRDLIAAFRRFQDSGCIEITTSAATHAFSPLLASDASLNAQFMVGAQTTRYHFGKQARGCWLPECGYRPGYEITGEDTDKQWRPALEATLKNNDIGYFFTEAHVIEGGRGVENDSGAGGEGSAKVIKKETEIIMEVTRGTTFDFEIYGDVEFTPLPERASTGCSTYEAYWLPEAQVAIMGRNARAGYQVWSAADGYPGNGCYREFHRKHQHSGVNYWSVTGLGTALDDKKLYDPVAALAKVEEHAAQYADLISELLTSYHEAQDRPGLLMISFDTELFGHWWFEGVEFIKQTILRLHVDKPSVERLTAGEYLDQHPPVKRISIPESSWGQGGHYWVWKNQQTEWMWPHIHAAEKRMQAMAQSHPTAPPGSLLQRALNQLARENLLLQSSDWPFLITTWQAHDYAKGRFRKHLKQFKLIADMIDKGDLDEKLLAEIESTDNCFPTIDYRTYLPVAMTAACPLS